MRIEKKIEDGNALIKVTGPLPWNTNDGPLGWFCCIFIGENPIAPETALEMFKSLEITAEGDDVEVGCYNIALPKELDDILPKDPDNDLGYSGAEVIIEFTWNDLLVRVEIEI